MFKLRCNTKQWLAFFFLLQQRTQGGCQRAYFARELEELRGLEAAGLLTIEPPGQPEWITVTPRGRFLVRNVCMVFDRHLRDRPVHDRYSKTV